MQQAVQHFFDEVRAGWRYRWYALGLAWLICLAGWAVVLVMPNKFAASARVFVDPSTALKPVIQGLAVEQDVNAELNLVRQSMLSEPALRKVVAEAGLDAKAVTDADRQGVVNALRNRIEVSVQPSLGDTPTPSKVYVIGYTDSTRDRSLRVVQILLDSFVEGTLGGKREGSQQAQQFLEAQIKDYERRLTSAEQSLAEFKRKNVGMVPGEQQGDYFSRLQNEMDAVKTAEVALNTAASRREALEGQLRGEGPVAASSGGNSTGVAGGPMVGGDTLARIKETQAKLDETLLRFTDKHPDAIALRENLEQLEARRDEELAALRRGDRNAAALTGASSNPIYQNIQLALNQSEIEVATLRSELGSRRAKVASLRNMLGTMPQVEAEYSRLNRDYEVTRLQYTALADRLEKARVGEDADAKGSVRFEIIDPPAAQFMPVSPKRSLLSMGVLLGALVAGGGLAYLLTLLRPVFSSVRALKEITGLEQVGSISLTGAGGALRRRVALTNYSIMLLALFIGLGAVLLVGQRYAPLSRELLQRLPITLPL